MAAQKTKPASYSRYKELADYLQRQRRNKRLSVRKVSLITNLPEGTIRALENPNKNRLPESNVRGLYDVYGSALGVTKRRIQDLAGVDVDAKTVLSVQRLPRLKSLVVFSNISTRIAGFVIISTVLLYALWQGLGLISSPQLEVAFPREQQVIVDESSIEIRGTASGDASVLINGDPITVDTETGEFSQVVFLQEGYNNISVEAINSFSKTAQQNFVLIYDPAERTALVY